MSKRDIWTLLEQPAPAGCEAVQDLFSWSLNYNAGTGPFVLFLDLIGYSNDEYGEPMYPYNLVGGFGYLELSKLAAALNEFTTDPGTVRTYVYRLMEAE